MRLDFVRWRLVFMGPQYGTCFVSPLWAPQNFEVARKYLKQNFASVYIEHCNE